MDGPSVFDNFRDRITELEQALAAAEARSTTAMREGLEEAARIADGVAAAHRAERATLANGPATVSERAMRGAAALTAEGLAERYRSRAASLPGSPPPPVPVVDERPNHGLDY